DVLAAKTALGTLLAFGQGFLLLLAVGALGRGAPVLLVALLLGAVLVTGLAMIAGSTGADFLGIVFLSVALMLPLVIPAFASLFPGSAATWVQALPSYGLVQVIIGAGVYGEGFRDSAGDLLSVLAWCLA